MKRLLIITYHFPPLTGASVERSSKFAQHLPSFGIAPIVLTGLQSARSRAARDENAELGFPGSLRVVRTAWPTGSRAERLRADQTRLELAAGLIAEERIGAILVSMSPFSDAGFAAQLSMRCDVPWIADLRDPWALDEFQIYHSRWHRDRSLHAMRRALSTAALIIMNTPEAADCLGRAFPEFARRTVSITNGFDAEDLTPTRPAPPNRFFTIVHAGFLHSAAGIRQRRRPWQYRLLGRIEPGVEILPRSHYYLLQALAQWRDQDPSMEEHVRFHLVGDVRSIDRELAAHSPVAKLTRFVGQVSRAESMRAVREADLLFLPMHKVAEGKRASMIPGKTFEYLASGRPILAPVPEGDARTILERAGSALICEPDNIEQMVAHLRARYNGWRAGEPPPAVNLSYLKTFEHREITRQLATRLDTLIRSEPAYINASAKSLNELTTAPAASEPAAT